ncbi:hypothetical protein DPQ33_05950 [Oceanidesulfovibrio indonesiensis]|uniref:Endonuclease/exonuclease/phosphatase domain-containing protein n=2 Tax=Oceanidesulfovibrio indonesiensis TaxID=54767 RepID=A0A7M3MG48_9BACT|nr:hypothetical protein DPQ33_05950 [Oceanidesulfovibrio indonesiensis]
MTTSAHKVHANGVFPMRVASYNVHGFRGRDGRWNMERIAEVIRELDAHVVGLQEVVCKRDCPRTMQFGDPRSVLADLAGLTGHHAITGINMATGRSPCCNALLVKTLPRDVTALDISLHEREPREVVSAVLGTAANNVRVATVHVGLGFGERLGQIRHLVELVEQWGNERTVILGDFNEWNPLSRSAWRISRKLGAPPCGMTFPAHFPLLPLDRLGVTPDLRLWNAHAHRSRLAREASDHLPVVGDVMPAQEPGSDGAS